MENEIKRVSFGFSGVGIEYVKDDKIHNEYYHCYDGGETIFKNLLNSLIRKGGIPSNITEPAVWVQYIYRDGILHEFGMSKKEFDKSFKYNVFRVSTWLNIYQGTIQQVYALSELMMTKIDLNVKSQCINAILDKMLIYTRDSYE